MNENETEAPSQMMTTHQLAKYLQVHVGTVYRMAKSGELPSLKIGTDWRFEKEAIDEWLVKARARAAAIGMRRYRPTDTPKEDKHGA